MKAAEALRSLNYEEKLDLFAIIYAALGAAIVSARILDVVVTPQKPALEIVEKVLEEAVVDALDGSDR